MQRGGGTEAARNFDMNAALHSYNLRQKRNQLVLAEK
jgi:hypothetical protein